jgi:hypothetical protein
MPKKMKPQLNVSAGISNKDRKAGGKNRGFHVSGEVPLTDDIGIRGSVGRQEFNREEGTGPAFTAKQKGIGVKVGPLSLDAERRSTQSPYYDQGMDKKMPDHTAYSGRLEEIPLGPGYLSGEASLGRSGKRGEVGKVEREFMARYRVPFAKGGKITSLKKTKTKKVTRGVGKALRGFGKALANGK